jgi:VanZ family protein
MRKLLWRWLPVIVWLAVIFGGSSIGSLPRADDKVLDAIGHRIAHMIEFAVLGALLLRALSERGSITWRQVLGVMLLCGLYGLTDEWHQAYVPGRSSELSAIPFDLGGGLIGAVIWRWWMSKKNLSGFPK